ncbi:MAG: 3TM-type holin [bacterium]
MIAALLPALVPILGKALGNLIPDANARAQAEAEIAKQLLASSAELERAAGEIVLAEARSEHRLTASWRPILMLTFGALIVARWLGYSAPGISEAEVLKLWDIVQLGLGGYVIGRSAEKVAPQIVAALKK